jgi:hypothetical protein
MNCLTRLVCGREVAGGAGAPRKEKDGGLASTEPRTQAHTRGGAHIAHHEPGFSDFSPASQPVVAGLR